MRENLYLNPMVRECQITNKVNKERDNANIDLKKKIYSSASKLMCTVVFLKESDTSLWRSQAKLIFKWSKATEPSKTKTWCRHDAHQHVWPLTCHLPNHSQTALLYFFLKTSSSVTTVWNKIGWKAKIKRRGGENGTGTNVSSCRRHVGPSMTVIRWHFWPPEKPQEF